MDQRSVYIGTYTSEGSAGIYNARFHTHTGAISDVRPVATLDNPSFLAKHPHGPWLYAVSERWGDAPGEVVAFRIGDDGDLTVINRQPSRGDAPCHLTVDSSGRVLLVANYGGGSVIGFSLEDDGGLGDIAGFHQHEGKSVHPERQRTPHAHSVYPYTGAGDHYVYVADLGTDRVMIYKLEKGQLVPNAVPFSSTPPGSGPRHIAFHPDLPVLYVANELDSTVSTFTIDETTGRLTAVSHVSTLPREFTGTSWVAHIHIHEPSGTVYVSNRGHDSLALFRMEPKTGALTPIGHATTLGETPRHFTIDPTGQFVVVANQQSDQLSVFNINDDGTLAATGEHATVSRPVCIVF